MFNKDRIPEATLSTPNENFPKSINNVEYNHTSTISFIMEEQPLKFCKKEITKSGWLEIL